MGLFNNRICYFLHRCPKIENFSFWIEVKLTAYNIFKSPMVGGSQGMKNENDNPLKNSQITNG